MFGHVIGITVDDTSRLPAHKMAHRVCTQPVDAVEVNAPLSPGFDWFFTDGAQWHARHRVPDMISFIDVPLALPTRIPLGVVGVFIEINRKIDPIASGGNFEFAVALDVLPIVT